MDELNYLIEKLDGIRHFLQLPSESLLAMYSFAIKFSSFFFDLQRETSDERRLALAVAVLIVWTLILWTVLITVYVKQGHTPPARTTSEIVFASGITSFTFVLMWSTGNMAYRGYQDLGYIGIAIGIVFSYLGYSHV